MTALINSRLSHWSLCAAPELFFRSTVFVEIVSGFTGLLTMKRHTAIISVSLFLVGFVYFQISLSLSIVRLSSNKSSSRSV